MAKLELKSLGKKYSDPSTSTVLSQIDLEVKPGQFVVLVGPSGCGKSALLRMIAGLEKVTEGQIILNGQDITHAPPQSRDIAMVFQNYALYPHLTVAENLGFALKVRRVPREEREQRVQEIARLLGLTKLLRRKPQALSGGQRQRVAIGRALVRRPKLFLFDEPLSNLDASLRARMRVELAELHSKLGITTVYVTHDQVEAMTLADEVVLLNAGRIHQAGPPTELYQNPENRFVASFLGTPAMNFIPLETGPHTGDLSRAFITGILPFPDDRLSSARTLGVRPEHLQVTSSEQALFEGTIKVVERLGAETLLYLGSDQDIGATLTVRTDGPAPARIGDKLHLKAAAEHLYLFDGTDRRVA